MGKPKNFDLSNAYRAATDVAREKDELVRAMLLERIKAKAEVNGEFLEQLKKDAESVVQKEADQLSLGPDDSISQEIVDDVVDDVEERYSSVLPEVQPERVEDLIFGTIEDIRKTFNLSLLLSQILFYSGLVMIVVSFVYALAKGADIIGLLFGAGGLISVLVSSLLMNPMDRIQNAAGDLVQLQMAYLSYYKQLYLLGGSRDTQTIDEKVKISREISRATVALMKAVQEFVETDQPKTNGDSISELAKKLEEVGKSSDS